MFRYHARKLFAKFLQFIIWKGCELKIFKSLEHSLCVTDYVEWMGWSSQIIKFLYFGNVSGVCIRWLSAHLQERAAGTSDGAAVDWDACRVGRLPWFQQTGSSFAPLYGPCVFPCRVSRLCGAVGQHCSCPAPVTNWAAWPGGSLRWLTGAPAQ